MNPKTAVITGGAGGLGIVTARHLAQAGMEVIIVGRDAARTAAATDRLRSQAPASSDTPPPRSYTADLSRWSQVRDLAARLADDNADIDVLINNAGAAFPRYGETEDQVERTYAINHHTPFLLTHALLATGAFAANARIVNISTFIEKRGRVDTRDPDVTGTSWRTRFYSQMHVYGTSKLLNILATTELSRRLPDGLQIYNANPGMVKNTSFTTTAGGLMRVTAPLFRPFSISSDKGVQTAVQLATAAPAPQPSGGFFTNSRPQAPSRRAQDATLARTVYEKTASLLNIDVVPAHQG